MVSAPTWRVRPTARAPIPTCRGEERRPAHSGRQGAALHQAWPSAASRSGRRRGRRRKRSQTGRDPSHLGVFFAPTARSIVLGWTSRPNSFWSDFANSRARIGSPGEICALRNAETSPWILCGPRGPRFLGTSSGNAAFVEIRLGLIVGRPRDSVLLGNFCHRRLLDRGAAQHLVLHLHDVAWIEEAAFLKLRVADLLGRRIERAILGERVGLRALAVTSCRHAEPRHKSAKSVIYYYAAQWSPSRLQWAAMARQSSMIATLRASLRRNLAYIRGIIILTHQARASSPKAARQDGPAP